jgi:hypothetical protein
MGRVVQPLRTITVARTPARAVGEGVAQAGTAGSETRVQVGDNYIDRTAKYVPAEVLGFFLFVNNILQQAVKTGGDKPSLLAGFFSVWCIAWLALILGTLLAPIYVWYVHEEGDAWKLNATISCVAFPIWAYAMGAVAFTGHLDGDFASILLASFTAVSGLFRPTPKDSGQSTTTDASGS